MKVLVTGGAGYIGSYFVERPLNNDNEVVVINATIGKMNCEGVYDDKIIESEKLKNCTAT